MSLTGNDASATKERDSAQLKLLDRVFALLVGTGGIEPPTSSVSRKRSPTELRAFTGEVD
jgi:hypothetical protein